MKTGSLHLSVSLLHSQIISLKWIFACIYFFSQQGETCRKSLVEAVDDSPKVSRILVIEQQKQNKNLKLVLTKAFLDLNPLQPRMREPRPCFATRNCHC